MTCRSRLIFLGRLRPHLARLEGKRKRLCSGRAFARTHQRLEPLLKSAHGEWSATIAARRPAHELVVLRLVLPHLAGGRVRQPPHLQRPRHPDAAGLLRCAEDVVPHGGGDCSPSISPPPAWTSSPERGRTSASAWSTSRARTGFCARGAEAPPQHGGFALEVMSTDPMRIRLLFERFFARERSERSGAMVTSEPKRRRARGRGAAYTRHMATAARQEHKHTIAEWLALPESRRVEFIDGEFIEKAMPDWEHSQAQGSLDRIIGTAFHRRGGSGQPGGWWLGPEIDIQLGAHGFRPDLSGWRRERVPTMPKGRPITIRPDWICEVVSESNATMDTVKKLRRYHEEGVPHYWLVDPKTKTLTVYRHQSEGYLHVLAAEAGETVRPEPFDAIELRVGLLFGEDPDDPSPPPAEE